MAAAKMDGVASSDLLQHRRQTKRRKGEDEQEQVVVLEGVEVDNKISYANVHVLSGRLEPYQAQVLNRSGRKVCLGSFATAEEAALCIARSPEGLGYEVIIPRRQNDPPPLLPNRALTRKGQSASISHYSR